VLLFNVRESISKIKMAAGENQDDGRLELWARGTQPRLGMLTAPCPHTDRSGWAWKKKQLFIYNPIIIISMIY
jgi:hypothetical protein